MMELPLLGLTDQPIMQLLEEAPPLYQPLTRVLAGLALVPIYLMVNILRVTLLHLELLPFITAGQIPIGVLQVHGVTQR